MKKKTVIIIAVVAIIALVAIILGFANGKKTETSNETNYPKIVYVDGNTYYATDDKCEMVPRKAPDGVIETFIQSEIMPDMMDSANFGSEYGSIEYMFLEDGTLIIHLGEDWYNCEMPQ